MKFKVPLPESGLLKCNIFIKNLVICTGMSKILTLNVTFFGYTRYIFQQYLQFAVKKWS
jgi:hypothetical protein